MRTARTWLAAGLLALAAGHGRADPRPNGVWQPPEAHARPRVPAIAPLPVATPLPNAAAGLALPYSGRPISVTTFHYRPDRTGWNPFETDLTPASVASGKFGLLTTLAVDGNVFAQPLLVAGFTMADGSTHDVLIAATGHNSVYAFDARTYALLWQTNLGQPQATADIGCTDVNPEYGISGTPVIVRSGPGHATVYVVSATEPAPFSFHTQLHALALESGQDSVAPADINPAAVFSDGSKLQFDPQNQWSRAGLAYANGSVYLSIGSHCDHGSGHIAGWILRYSPQLALRAAFHTVADAGGTELASIWMSGFAPAVNGRGELFAVTGNGDFQPGRQDYGESVLRLPPSLAKVTGSFTPHNFTTLNQTDSDLGSGGIVLLPVLPGQAAPPLMVTMGKDGVLWLLDQDRPGHVSPDDSGALQKIGLSNPWQGLWGGPAYYNGPAGPTVFVQRNGDVMRGYAVNTGATPGLTQTLAGTTTAGYGGSTPIVSSNGAKPGTGVLWTIRRASPLQLEAYDATTLGAPIYAAATANFSSQGAFLTPMQANGRVYVGGAGSISVFGLAP